MRLSVGQMIFFLLLFGMAIIYFTGATSLISNIAQSFTTVGYMLTNRLPNGQPAGYARV